MRMSGGEELAAAAARKAIGYQHARGLSGIGSALIAANI
jgi:hypothetical protein